MVGARKKFVAAGGIALTVALGVAGCGQAQQLSAKQHVSKAMSGFEDAKAAAFTVKLATTKADLQAISSAQGDTMSAADLATVDKILAGNLAFTVQAPDGKTLGEASKESQKAGGSADLMNDPQAFAAALQKQGSFSMTANLSGSALAEFRFVGGKLYAKADAARILQLADQDPAQLDQALAQLPPSLQPLAKGAKNQWVSLDLVKAVQAAKDNGALKNLPTPSPSPSVDAAKVQKLVDDLKAAYNKQATITEIGKDDDRGQGYRLGAPAKRVATAVQDDLIALVGQSGASQVRRAISTMPDKTFYLELWVKDDQLTDVQLDLTQFMDKPVSGKKLAVDIAVDTSPAEVTAPGGATAVDVDQVVKELSSSLGSLGSPNAMSGSGTASGSGSLGMPDEKAARQQLKDAGLSDADIDRILGSK